MQYLLRRNLMGLSRCLMLFGVLLLASNQVRAQAGVLHHGNLIVCSPTGGSSAASVVKLYQYTPGGSIVDSVVLPSTGANELTTSGTASSEGFISLSAEKDKIVVVGYASPAGTTSVASGTANRVIGTVDSTETFTLQYSQSVLSTKNARGGTSYGSNFFESGSATGIYLMNTATLIESLSANNRNMNIFAGNTYFTSGSSPYQGISQMGTGISTATSQTPTLIASSGSTTNCYGFSISPDGNTAYIADATAGIQKFTRSGNAGLFTAAGYTVYATPCSGICVDYSTSNPTIYATLSSGLALISFTDAGSTVTSVTTLATATSAQPFRGVCFAPSVAASISGTTSICSGGNATITFAGNPNGLISYSVNGTPATIQLDSAYGQATLNTGTLTSTTTYALSSETTPFGTTSLSGSAVITISSLPAIGGTTTTCAGFTSTTALTNSTSGGTWSSSTTGIATVGTTGIVTGVSAGSAIITYSLGGTCFTTTTETILPALNTISLSNSNICALGTATVTITGATGTWSSGNTTIATVGATSGVITGLVSGTDIITFTSTAGCATTTTETVISSSAGTLSGFSFVCLGLTTPLSSSVSGGTWSSSNTSVASVGSTSGVVTGVANGSATMTYALTTTCGSYSATYPMTVGTLTVPTPIVSPTVDYLCPTSPAQLVYTHGDTTTGSVTLSNTTTVFTIPQNAADSSSIIMSGVPAGAVITNVSITVNVGNTSGAYQSDNLFNLRAPNGNIINVDNFHGSSNTGFTNVTYGSAGTLAQSSSTLASGNLYIASLINGAPTSGSFTTPSYRSNTTSWSSLYSTANGQWTLITDNDYNATEDTLKNWTITVNYAIMPTVTWMPVTGLYTNTSGTTAYTGTSASSVYALPTSTTTYTVTANMGGCTSAATTVMNAGASIPAITGPIGTCVSSSITLNDIASGGTWSSSAAGIATVGTSGVVTGASVGTVIITYAVSGCISSSTVTIVPAINPITNGGSLCALTTTTLGDLTPGGTWTSSNTTVVSIGASTGVVNGLSGGTSTITYMSPVGCTATVTETVTPFPISGNASTCIGSSTILSDATAGGTWSISSGVASVGSTTGVLTGLATGTTVVTYTAPVGGCIATATETVVPAILPITGTGSICATTTTTLGDLTPGGTWTSSNTGVATVGISTGVISGVAFGTIIVTYTSPAGCITTALETIMPNNILPVSGSSFVCFGATTTLTDLTPGGTWSSSNGSIASVNSTSGIVSGIAFGTATMTYSVSNTCGSYTTNFPIAVTTVPVPTPSITPALASLCPSSTPTLLYAYADTLTGSVTFSNSTPFVEPQNNADSSSVIVSGIPVGAVITNVAVTLNVNAKSTGQQRDNIFNLRGPNGSIINLDNGRGSSTGGVGFSNVTISALGSLAQSSATITSATPYIASLISGAPTSGSFLTTSYRANATTWNSLYSAPNGQWTLITDNTYNATEDTFENWSISISYAIYPTVTWSPVSGLYSNTGGTVSYTGANTNSVYALPTTTTAYSVTANMGGCTSIASVLALVNPSLYVPAITGASAICAGASTSMTDSTTGGTWTSGNTAIANIGTSNGVLAGVSAGTVIISYNLNSGSCSGVSTKTITVNALPVIPAISGSTTLCLGSSAVTLLSDGSVGGTWISANPAVATVGASSGIVNGLSAGTTLISYNYSNGTCSNYTTTTVTVANSPASMTISPAVASVCTSGTPTMLVASGASLPAISTTSSGTISFSIPNSAAGVTTSLTVTSIPSGATVTGIAVNYNATESFDGDLELNLIAPNASIINLFSSGTSNNGANFVNTTISSAATSAIPNLGAGAPWTGVWAANASGSLTVGSNVYHSTTTSWAPLEAANPNGTWVLAGRSNYGGNTATLTSWSLTISYSYQAPITWLPVTGLYNNTSGTSAYTGTASNTVYAFPTTNSVYTATGSNGVCVNSAAVTVHSGATLYVPVVTGAPSVCIGATDPLSDSTLGGVWSSGNPVVATVGTSSGIVTPVAPGTATITYTLNNGSCSGTSVKIITVNPLPVVAPIGGAGIICSGTTRSLTETTVGGTWSSGAPSIAIIGTSGIVSAVSPGIATISYNYSNGTCSNMVSALVTAVNTPTPIMITPSSSAICAGGPSDKLVASGGLIPGTVVASSTSAPFVEGIFADANTSSISISSIPAGSMITRVSVAFNIGATSGQYQSDNIFNLMAPNGNIINLDFENGGGSGSGGFPNITISSTGTTALSSATITSANNYAAALLLGQGPTTPTDLRSNATTWASLYSVPNGSWTFIPTNDYSATEDTFKNWTITINYLAPATNLWTSSTGLFGDSAATIPYIGSSIDTVFAEPTSSIIYTVTASNGVCSVSNTASVTVNPLPAPIAGTQMVCTGLTTPLFDGSFGGSWSSSNLAVGTIGVSTGVVAGVIPGTTIVTYTLGTGCTTMATVTVNQLPATFTVGGGGAYCISGTSPWSVTLSGSEMGVNYQLYNGLTPVGLPVAGTGSSLNFGIESTAGSYTVIATNPSTTCSMNMTGSATITVNPLPAVHNVIHGGHYCAGGSGVDISLDGSDTGISYQLYKGTSIADTVVPGTGAALDFGLFTAPGSYTVMAMNGVTGCQDNMSSSADVSIDPLPSVYMVSGSGSYCFDGAGRHITLSGSNFGIRYQLYNNGTSLGSPLQGIDAVLDFGSQTDSGAYTVIATDTTTSCVSNMIDTASITINPLPAVHSVTGGGSYCPAGTGVAIGLNSSDLGKSYQLYNGTTMVGTPVNGTGSSISFGLHTTGTYVVVAKDTTTLCTNNMSGLASVSLYSLPTAFNVTGSGSYCNGGTGVDLGLDGSVIGVKYQLYYGTVLVGSPVWGTGIAIDLGSHTGSGSYTVIAKDTATTCTANMADTATIMISPLPTGYMVTGSGSYCAGGTGLHVGLSSSDTGISYSLYLSGSALGSPLSGTGSSLDFGLDTAGVYKIVATNTHTSCVSNMTDSAVIVVNPLPEVFTIYGGGGYCASGTGVHVNLSGSDTGIHYQLYDGTATSGSYVSGTGAALDFGLRTASGAYTVMAKNATTLCTSEMAGTTTITVNPLPTQYSITGGGSYCAGGTGVHIGLAYSNLGVVYQLYHTGSATGSPVGGTGSSIDFGLDTLAGTYTIVATDTTTHCNNNMTGTDTVRINTIVTPSISVLSGHGVTICQGTGTTFTATPTNGGPVPIYRWTVDGFLVGTDSASFSYVPANGDVVQATLISDAICPAFDTAMSAPIAMTVMMYETPTIHISANPGSTNCETTPVAFRAATTYDGPSPLFSWMVNGTHVGTDSTYTYTPVNGDVVSCELTSDFMCRLATSINSNDITMSTVTPIVPSVEIMAYPGSTVTKTHRDSLVAVVTNGGSAPLYQWSVNNTAIPGATTSTFVRSNFVNGDSASCVVTRTDACGLSSFNGLFIHVAPNTGVVVVNSGESNIMIVPNPNKGDFIIKGTLGTTDDQEVTIELTDLLGQVVYSNKIMARNGELNEQVALSNNIANAMYILNLHAGSVNNVFHIVIEQ